MLARFLLGPAGSGKTFRCLAEIRETLKENPEGVPVIFLAPKQATFQLERQLLSDHSLPGFTRLHILSFERLALLVMETLNVPPPRLLSEDGRIMVLRALLSRHGDMLKSFRRSARRPGFAQQLSQLLRELQQHQVTSAKLHALADNGNLRQELREKLDDLALMLGKYARWLADNDLKDANCLLDFATEALRGAQNPNLKIDGLYLDGFAEMTPQELDLLAAIIPSCERAVLAFCVDETNAEGTNDSWLSIWNAVGRTLQQCRQRLESLPGIKIEREILSRQPEKSRFAKSASLRSLEKNWQAPGNLEQPAPGDVPSGVSIHACANPEAEAVFGAREISRFVRAGNRFRDCAVLVRDLESYHQPLARVFRRHQIPFFIDRRESVSHHPLAELTRGALRAAAFDWRHDDFFSALKSGFFPAEDTEIDRLENAALEFGWRGGKWRQPLPDESFERLRKRIFPAFENFYHGLVKLNFAPNGRQLAETIRGFWEDLQVQKTLEKWSAAEEKAAAIHATVREQMAALLENLELGLGGESLALADWLPVLESGLANLTVGVIPPVLDEVLIGAIDRARNPDLKFAAVLGVNESIFPAAPPSPVILTESDRDELPVALGPDLRERVSRERFYGYIACTRASEKLALTFARNAVGGTILNPSPFINHLRRIFPALEIKEFEERKNWEEIENAAEIAPLIFEFKKVESFPALTQLRRQLLELQEPDAEENLSPPMAERLYGPVLRTSVSRLEEFAGCPFRFFVRSGLRAEERKVFELDARERGSFQHDILKKFHEGIIAEGRRWRDLTPAEARERIHRISEELIGHYHSGLMNETAQSRFAARALTETLQDFAAVTVSWLREQNEFDPVAAELDFGTKESPQSAWKIGLEHGRTLALNGRIDRVDLHRGADGRALAIVLDYKSSRKKLEALLVEHGIQLQLLAYLNVLRQWENPAAIFGANKLVPAGVFYVNLRGQFENGDTRDEVLSNREEARRTAYRHAGRFDAGVLDKLDGKRARDQFNYRLTKTGELYAGSVEALPHPEFQQLLDRVETQLREFGNEIFAGVARVDPYRKGSQKACDYCDYSAACRIDPWTHKYRVLG
ncbi:MAG: PD-(D/E)XK nuclease family protein [Limisphaerales bacterium]